MKVKLPEIHARHKATLLCRGPAPLTSGEQVMLGHWEWEDACEVMPTAPLSRGLPGAADGGIFVVDAASFRLTGRAHWFFGGVRLLIGERNYFDVDVGLFPLRFGGSLAIPPQQLLVGYVKDWGFGGNAPLDADTKAELRLHGTWGTELK